MFQELQNKYADLAVRVGVNIQPGQKLLVRAPIDSAEFTRVVVKKAYEAGAKEVVVLWNDDICTRTRYELAPDDSFDEFPEYYVRAHDVAVEENWALLSIVSANPDLLKGIPADRIARANKAAGLAMDDFRTAMQADKVSWNIVACPSQIWADKVFPELPEELRMEALWNAIFQATRSDLEDPVAAWDEHVALLDGKSQYLNNSKFHALHLTAPGTDLTIELPELHLWAACGSHNEQGTLFVANIPTEEVFTLPRKEGVHGTVSNTLPLIYSGNVIDGFTLTFEHGKIVDFTAEEGYETLQGLLDTDEGSRYIGEIALVPYDSPISNTNILFYNTLFDENASCHLAIGSAYAFNLEGGKTMNKEELLAAGANQSITHVDFMIGSKDMSIDGITKDGERVAVFRNGNWV